MHLSSNEILSCLVNYKWALHKRGYKSLDFVLVVRARPMRLVWFLDEAGFILKTNAKW